IENVKFDLHWVNQLVEEQKYLQNSDEFIQTVKGELFPEDVFVFTPKGDLIRLPYGSCSIDFGYAIHSDIGHHIVGAKVNGTLVSLDHVLENGDTVEVIMSKSQVPNRDWLNFVRSSKAKQRIRAFLKTEEQSRFLAFGMELLTKDLRKVRLSLKKLEKGGELERVASEFGLSSAGELYAQVGYGKLSTTKVIARLLPDEAEVERALRQTSSPLERIFQRAARASRKKIGVKVSGVEDILVRFAKCCEPLPGDRITGFITRGRGVTVHRMDCSQVMRSDPLRQIDVSWDNEVSAPRPVRIIIHSLDHKGLLSDISRVITDSGANIFSAQVKTTTQGKAVIHFELSIDDAKHMLRLTRSIEQVSGVTRVDRITGSSASDDEDAQAE
ncbi:MAG: bifunctional (p)ppGpp synthetase/guanosine-3',5'-bis(diphosphate) 3'-pyrophosphohydrolase, partial [Bdellovibrionales bacterium]|nr:bifunctional (p)ppGpp synthetase/guanosine-3',5'-bis(diphosphate) 3'-pyrophosphohydrolase [Bdellovibrionales bacterium]